MIKRNLSDLFRGMKTIGPEKRGTADTFSIQRCAVRLILTSVEFVKGWSVKGIQQIREIWLGQITVGTNAELWEARVMTGYQYVTMCHRKCPKPTSLLRKRQWWALR